MNKRLMLVLFLMLLAAPLYAQEYGLSLIHISEPTRPY